MPRRTWSGGEGTRWSAYVLRAKSWYLALTCLVAIVAWGPPADHAIQGQTLNPIAAENALPGNPASEWQITGAGDPSIQGFSTEISVDQGGTISFKITTDANTYRIDIYRLGYYAGNGARKVHTIDNLVGTLQPTCLFDNETGLHDCGNWAMGPSWDVPADATSGLYIARLTRTDTGGASHIPFVVRDDDGGADLLFQTADTTWQAYNFYGGSSLALGGPGVSPPRAFKVSYNRPITTREYAPESYLFNAEYPMLRWLEANGYHVSYTSGVDTDRHGSELLEHRVFLSVGQDENWSAAQRANVEAARDAGVHLAFFSGNSVFWKTRWEASIDGTNTAHRTLVSYRETHANAKIDPQPNVWTGTWRDPRPFNPEGGQPENALTGTFYTVVCCSDAIRVPGRMGKQRFWRNTSIRTLGFGQIATMKLGTLGHRWDEDIRNEVRPPGLIRMSSTTIDVNLKLTDHGSNAGPGTAGHALTLYRHPSNALVFGAGSVQYSWGLDSTHDRGSLPAEPAMQQATVNLFADMGVSPVTLQPGLVSGVDPAFPADLTGATATFSQPAPASTLTRGEPFFIRGLAADTGGVVASVEVSIDDGVTWKPATGTETWTYRWTPAVTGPVTIRARAIDDSGNIEAPGATLNVTVQPRPPDIGPGGPILVISSAARPFTGYLNEILRTEGLNNFRVMDVTTLTPAALTGFDVAILGDLPIDDATVAMLSNWVAAGGNLIAMRPDKKLYGLLGLTDLRETVTGGYLQIDTSRAPGKGIVSRTMQFHGDADLVLPADATTVATLYANLTTPLPNPLVTVRSLPGSGQAAAFLFDLAKSIVWTRGGNPAWEGQERDLIAPIRSSDLFYGALASDMQPDWNNLANIDVPIADEQQRLLANLILHVTTDRKPIPRFWYFPDNHKAVVVMTGDEHGSGDNQFRFNEYLAFSAPGCSVENWKCVRSTGYMYPEAPAFPNSVAANFEAMGFEIALHPNTFCRNFTAASLDVLFTTQLGALAENYPSLQPPRTNRMHCIVYSDYSTLPEKEFEYGIRFDVGFYHWPAKWIQDRPGFFNGSGMPMRFARKTGETIDVFQSVSYMTDESDQSWPFTIDRLLDGALQQGYYGAFTANMHGDNAIQDTQVVTAQIVASAQARGVPVVTAAQMLDWLDGRNASSFENIGWTGTVLSFTVARAPKARGLQAMVPFVGGGGPLAGITHEGAPVTFTTETIKGVMYALFPALPGTYQATYPLDVIQPAITNVAHNVLSGTSALVTWTTDEDALSRVDFGTSPTALNSTASGNVFRQSHGVQLTGLTPDTIYYYRVSSADLIANTSTAPPAERQPRVFRTYPPLTAFRDTTVADFSSSTLGAGAAIAERADGELILAPVTSAEFAGSSLQPGWSSTIRGPGGSANVGSGILRVDHGAAVTDATYGAGHTVEFVATFGTEQLQHAGFAETFTTGEPWAIFSTWFSKDVLYARSTNGAQFFDTPIKLKDDAATLGIPHRFRIVWTASGVTFYVDGQLVATHTITINTSLRLSAGDYELGGITPRALDVNWMRLAPFAPAGTTLSRVFDGGGSVSWFNLVWNAAVPVNTGLAMSVRTGNTPTPDGSWTAFAPVSHSGALIRVLARYAQYRAELTTGDFKETPELQEVTLNSSLTAYEEPDDPEADGGTNTPPVSADDSYSGFEDRPFVLAAPGILANDHDANGEALQVSVVSPPATGTLVVSPDGGLTFTPAVNAFGPVTFTYRATDAEAGGEGNLATVTLNIAAVNDAPSFVKGLDHEVVSGNPQTVAAWATSILAGPADEAAQTLTFVIDSNDNPGLFLTPPVVAASGTLTYTPRPSARGVANITLRLTDNGGTANGGVDSSTAVTFAITAVTNDPPVSADDTYAGLEDTAFVLAAPGVLANDSDPNGDALQAVVVSPPATGSLALGPDGSITYTPAGNVIGPVTFTYRATDTRAGGDGNVATVALTIAGVNDAPSFVKGTDQAAASVSGAQTVWPWATSIAAGPADEAPQTLTFVIDGNDNPSLFLTQPVVAANGGLTYTPRPFARGVANITLRLTDNGGTANGGIDTSPAATFAIRVTNAPPVSGDDVYASLEDMPFVIAAPGVLANDSDGDGDAIQVAVVSPPATGTLVLGPDGSLTYTPAANVTGPVAFTYRATDTKADGDGNLAIVTLNIAGVNDAPSFVKGVDQSVPSGSGAQTVAAWATSIAAGSDDEAAQTLTFVIESNDNPGLFLAPPVVAASGTLTYTPTPYALGVANIRLRLADNGGTANGGIDSSPVVSFAIKVTGQGAAYGFEELSGGSIVDSSGNNNTGTFDPVTGPQRTESGRFGRGMAFNGLDDMINVADHSTLDLTSAMTLMAWIKVDNRSGWRTILMKERSPEFSYALYAADADASPGRPTGYVRTGSITRTVAGLEVAPINGWMHVAVTMGTSQLRFYVNGVLHRSVASSGSLTTSNNPLRLGGNQAYPDEFFSGVMDEVRIFGRELTVDDIRKLMQTPVGSAVSVPTPPPPPPPSPSSGLVAAYNFNDGTATDKSGLGNNGVLSGPQAVDGALRFDGVNDLVSIAAVSNLDLSTAMTVEAWVRPASVTGWRSIIVKEAPAPLGLSYALYASDPASRVGAYVAINGDTRDLPGSVLPVNVWTHVVMTYDSSTLRIWIDGVPNTSLPVTGAIAASTSQLSIGGNRLWGEYFEGLIDNVRIYNRALDAGEIQSNRVTPVP